jgi:hypothetical protein
MTKNGNEIQKHLEGSYEQFIHELYRQKEKINSKNESP